MENVNLFSPITAGISNQDIIESVTCGMYHTVVITSKSYCFNINITFEGPIFEQVSKIEKLEHEMPFCDLILICENEQT